MLLLGTLAGAAVGIAPLELEGTTWEAAQVHLSLFGAGTLAGFAALWFWAPKIWGVHLGEAAGKSAFALTFLGAVLLAAPDLVNGLVENVPLGADTFDGDLVTGLNVVRAIGGGLAALGVLVVVFDLLGKVARHKGRPAADDPWGGFTLEWATSSPPPRENFSGPLPPVASPTPLLEAPA
jgi:heme/copper-type cytochrome/quinol oxidase subunit 1